MKKHLLIATLFAGSVAAGYGTAALADLKYTQVTRSGDDPKAVPMQSTTTFIGPNGRRVETKMNMGPVQMNSIALTICDKRQEIKLDPSLKIYTVTPLDQKSDATTSEGGQTSNNAPKQGESTGKIINTSTVQDLGEETVADVQTRHYVVTQRIQSSGCAGDSDTTMKMEIWVAPGLKEPNSCPAQYDATAMPYQPQTKSNCKITFEQKGDTAAMAKAYDGLIMRMKMYMGDKVVTVQEVTALSRAKLDEALFTVPADFKQVSDEEYQKAQSAAMMQAMMQSMQAGNGGDDDAEEDAQDEEAASEKREEEKPAEEKPRDKPRLPFKLPRF